MEITKDKSLSMTFKEAKFIKLKIRDTLVDIDRLLIYNGVTMMMTDLLFRPILMK